MTIGRHDEDVVEFHLGEETLKSKRLCDHDPAANRSGCQQGGLEVDGYVGDDMRFRVCVLQYTLMSYWI